ncbi:MAG: hypothetical protein IPL23_25095 [Saprospiraceae bacterium]|mgnify:CR=1 FL=1|nr:hypothetical protein [Saprospiraceae bacterium]MBK8633734.1 hypothetical protein [Saprospiraceae bacterium]MBP7641886.1 hypothetical protein [Saprospiraceae bacterium]HMS68867.1 FtsL-like putative cell division protein [Saprospiraceae bacterium]HOY12859.1 FtsL-like putative cell division protein [Saprospiraceae bacterium]
MSGSKDKKSTTFIRSRWAEWVFVNLPFVFFIVGIGVVYIFNAHSAERAIRKIDSLKKEVNDYRWQAMTLEQELMYQSTQSQLTKNLEEKGLKPLNKLPLKLESDKEK